MSSARRRHDKRVRRLWSARTKNTKKRIKSRHMLKTGRTGSVQVVRNKSWRCGVGKRRLPRVASPVWHRPPNGVSAGLYDIP